jgi:ADP-ribose pyrophosphatase YjhB (NUDIX family)
MPEQPFKDFVARPDYLGVFGFLETPGGVLVVGNRRVIGGRPMVVWDLPGGGVEPAETLPEALRREMREETALEVAVKEMPFVAEGERVRGGVRTGVWRSFFFRIERLAGDVDTSGEPDIVDHRLIPRADLAAHLEAPYHKGFLTWLADPARVRYAFDAWHD